MLCARRSRRRFDLLARRARQKGGTGQATALRFGVNGLKHACFKSEIHTHDPRIIFNQRNTGQEATGRQCLANIFPRANCGNWGWFGQILVFRPEAQRLDGIGDDILLGIGR